MRILSVESENWAFWVDIDFLFLHTVFFFDLILLDVILMLIS